MSGETHPPTPAPVAEPSGEVLRRLGVAVCARALREDWTREELVRVLEQLDVVPYEKGGGTDSYGNNVMPAARTMRRVRARQKARTEGVDTGEDVA